MFCRVMFVLQLGGRPTLRRLLRSRRFQKITKICVNIKRCKIMFKIKNVVEKILKTLMENCLKFFWQVISRHPQIGCKSTYSCQVKAVKDRQSYFCRGIIYCILVVFRMEKLTDCGDLATTQSSSLTIEYVLQPCTVEDRLSVGWQKTFVANRKNPLLLDLVYYSPDLKVFRDLAAAQKFDFDKRGNWGHYPARAESGEPSKHVVNSDRGEPRWRQSEMLKKDFDLYHEQVLTVSDFAITDRFKHKNRIKDHPGMRQFSAFFEIDDFENTKFSKLFGEKDRKTAIDIFAMLQVVYFIRKKLRSVHSRWHWLVADIERQSNYLLHNECCA